MPTKIYIIDWANWMCCIIIVNAVFMKYVNRAVINYDLSQDFCWMQESVFFSKYLAPTYFSGHIADRMIIMSYWNIVHEKLRIRTWLPETINRTTDSNPTINSGWTNVFRKFNSYCSTSGTCRVNITNTVIDKEWRKYLIMNTTMQRNISVVICDTDTP